MSDSFVVVDENGYEVDVVLLETEDAEGNPIPIPKNHVSPNTSKRLWKPKWNFESEEWEEGLSEEEVQQRELEIVEQENQPNEFERLKQENEMLAMAVMELSSYMLQGGK